jgi:hypothetical protein
MSIVTDIRAVSENAIEQVADRFDDLPRPLLAAIGAGDLAVERLAALRESLRDQLPQTTVDDQDVRSLAAELPGMAQKLAADLPATAQKVAADLPATAQKVAAELPGMAQKAAADAQKAAFDIAASIQDSIQAWVTQLPAKAQELVAELPEMIDELRSVVSVDTIRASVEAYTQLLGSIYGSLADRGDKTWSKVRSGSLAPGTVVDAVAEAPKPVSKVAPRATTSPGSRAAAAPAGPKRTAARRTTGKPSATKSAGTKSAGAGSDGSTTERPSAHAANGARPKTAQSGTTGVAKSAAAAAARVSAPATSAGPGADSSPSGAS